VFNHQGTLTVRNSTMALNVAQGGSSLTSIGGSAMGGAVFNLNGTVTLANATIDANRVTAGVGASLGAARGGAIYNVSYDKARARLAAVTLINTLASGNGAPDLVNDNNLGGGTATVDESQHNIVTSQATLNGAAIIGSPGSTDPQLGRLPPSLGQAWRHRRRPRPARPSTRAPAASCPPTDERGVARPDQGEATCDLGAVELGDSAAMATTTVTTMGPTLAFTGDDSTSRNLVAAGLALTGLLILGLFRRPRSGE
jgi:LPXTG-motif cell wall-anchored protein